MQEEEWSERKGGEPAAKKDKGQGLHKVKGECAEQIRLSGFDEQVGAGILRQIHEFHSAGRMQLAKGVEGTAVFLRIPHSPY